MFLNKKMKTSDAVFKLNSFSFANVKHINII